MENKIIKNFSWWDAIVLLVLLLIFFPFLLSSLESFLAENYTMLLVSISLTGLTLLGIIKYIKKIINGFKCPESSKKT